MSMRGILQALCLVLVAVCLGACNEDVGRSSSGSSPSLAVSSASLGATKPVLSVSTESLGFQGQEGDTAPASRMITGRISPSGSKPPYVDVTWSSNGLSSVLYDLSGESMMILVMPKDPAATGIGTFTDQIVINACEDSWCRRHIDGSPKTVTVTYTVRNRLVAQPAALSFAHVLGRNPPPSSKALSLQGTSVHWTASADRSWIQLSGSSGGTPGSLTVGIDPTGLAIGDHAGNITFTNIDTGELTVVPVTLQVAAPTLSIAPGALSFSGLEGKYLPAQPLLFSLDTGSSAYAWGATVDTGSGPEWLILSSTSGTVSSSPTGLAVSVNTSGLPGGTYSGNLTITTSVEGHSLSRTIPVSLSLASPLWVADNGVALVSTPAVSKLTHTVTVKDRWAQSSTAWTATADVPWLSVTPSGISGGSLTMTAQPAGLETNTLHYARVTVTYGNAPAQGSETIRVGLWVGASAPTSQHSIPEAFQVIETDPVRPYVYVHNGGGTLRVYNIYTGSLVTSLTDVASNLGAMTISSDGSTLYALDTIARRIVPVDLVTLTPGSPWALSDTTSTAMAYTRPNGQGMVLTNGGKIFEAKTGAAFPSVTGGINTSASLLSASLDGSLFCGLTSGYYYYYYSLYCYGLRYTEASGGAVTFSARPSSPYGVSYGGMDVAINHDGSRVYVAAESSYITVHDGQTMNVLSSLAADYYTNAVEVGPDNRLYASTNSPYGSKDVWVYNNAGASQGSYRTAGYYRSVLSRQLKVSGDGKRFVVLTDDPSLKLVTAP
jgi:hypothetical protein